MNIMSFVRSGLAGAPESLLDQLDPPFLELAVLFFQEFPLCRVLHGVPLSLTSCRLLRFLSNWLIWVKRKYVLHARGLHKTFENSSLEGLLLSWPDSACLGLWRNRT